MELLRQSASSVLADGVRLTLDLRNIYFIDCEGVELIKSLTDRGVRQVNAPLFVAEQIWSARLDRAIEFERGKAYATQATNKTKASAGTIESTARSACEGGLWKSLYRILKKSRCLI